MSTITLDSIVDIQACVKDNQKLHIIGKGTKSAFASQSTDSNVLSLAGLSGITEYQPEEYTITAYAGTPVQEIQSALQENGQYLPFDPMLAKTASIGGTVATNLSGSLRFRYGGVRDFILGVHVVDGLGRAFRCGGKVVKNSAGFDLAKFFVGSLGQYAIMTELTFKIFPVAPEFATLQLHFDTLSDVLSALFFINQSVFELDALDIEPNGDRWTMLIRLNGHGDTLPARCERFITTIKGQTACVDVTQSMNDPIVWDAINNLSWAKDAKHVVKVVVAPKQIPALDQDIQSSASQRRYSVGGNVAWIATDDLSTLSSILETHQLTGLPIFGIANSTTIGKPKDNVLSDRVKQIFDPENKFN